MKDEDVRVPDEVREKILATLATRLADNENALDGDKLNAHQRRALRSIFGDYANLLEEALFPVYAKVADREIVMQQIRPYLSGEILKDFEPLLRIYGRKYLPCTIAYIDEHQMTFFDWKERRRQSLQLLENQRHRGA
jgi:hypothetical protein